MAITKFNSIDGYTVSDSTQITVVDANANFYANNLTVSATSDLGAVGNVKITGGTANYILQTNGSGVLSWTNPGAVGLAGSNRQVQYNNDGNFGASSNFTFNSATNLLTVGNLAVSGDSNLGNLATANYFSGNGYAITGLPLGNLSDVTFTSPVLGQIIAYNGVHWVNINNTVPVSAGAGVDFWFTTPIIEAVTANNDIQIDSLSLIPNTAAQTYASVTVNGTGVIAAFESGPLNRTVFDAGNWDFSVWANVSSTSGTTTLAGGIYQTIPYSGGTITVTGTGTSRTATASAGTPFSSVTAGSNVIASSYIQTQLGIYRITAKTSDTVVTINTPSGYTNESAVESTVWNPLFTVNSVSIISTSIAEYIFGTTEPEYSVTTSSGVGLILSTTTSTSKTVNVTINGTQQSSHFTTPFHTLHDSLAGLQGGQADEYYHLTTSEYTGNGTGTFIRQSSPTLITPNVGVASGTSLSVTGNISSGNANLGNLATANYFSGNGIYISNIAGANVSGTVANANYSTYAGTVTTAAQPNITSLGTLSSVTITGNITSGNANLGNLVTANYFTGNGIYISNIAGGNVSGQVGNALVAGTVYTNAQPNITSVGTLASLNVTGTVNAGNFSVGTGTGGNITGANLITANYFVGNGIYLSNIAGANVYGNVTSAVQAHYANIANYIAGANVNGQVSNALVAGTVYTNAQPNITSVGTLANVSVTGVATLPQIRFQDSYTQDFSASYNFNSYLNIGEYQKIMIIAPSGNFQNYSIYGKIYVQLGDNTQIMNVEVNLRSNTLPDLAWEVWYDEDLNGISSPYVNPVLWTKETTTAGFVFAVAGLVNSIHNMTVQLQVVNRSATYYDNVTLFTGPEVSVIDTGYSSQAFTLRERRINGVSDTVYTPLIVSGNLTATNANLGNLVTANYFSGNGSLLTNLNGANVNGQVGNALVSGTVYTNAQPNITSVGTLVDTILGSANSLTGGNLVSATYLTGTLTTSIQPNITSVGTLVNTTMGSSNSLSGGNLVSATFISGNGIYISNIAGANVYGNVTSAVQAHYANIANYVAGADVNGQVGNALVAGTVYTNAQPNITSLGTLSSLGVSGDATITGNLTVTGTTIYANVTTLNVKDPIIEMGGNPDGSPLTTNDGKDRGTLLHYYTTSAVDAFMGWDNSNAEFAFGSNVSISSEVITFNNFGNVRANYFLGNASQLLGTIANANYSTYAGTVITSDQPNITSVGTLVNTTLGSANSLTGGNLLSATYLTGTLTTATQPNITSVGTLTSLTITANISSGNANLGNLATASYFSGNGIYISNIAGANVSGQVGNATVAGTVYTNAQPNITSVGSLSGLTVSNTIGVVDFTNTANVTLGAIANLHISGGTTGAVLSTDGSGVLTWTSSGSVGVAGVDKQIQFNDNGNFGADANFTFTKSTSTLATKNITLQSTGNLTGGNLVSATYLTGTLTTAVQPNITSVGTLVDTTLGASNSFTGGNLVSANYLTGTLTTAIQPNITSVGTLVNTTLGSSNSLTGGNLVSATYLTGTLTTGAQPNVTSLGSLVSLTITGNITSGNANLGNLVTANYFSGNGIYISNITGANVYGNVTSAVQSHYANIANSVAGSNVSGQVSNALVAGTVYTNAQPNITSVGTLSGLTVNGLSNLGDVANVTITGGTAGYSLTTDGYGALSWQPGSGSGGGFVSIIRNSFTGNGVQTNFNLSTTPTGEAALLVNLNGLIQIDTTYSLSGSTLIFSTAPAAGAKIEVTIYGALAITETDTQVLFISGTSLSGSANFTFDNTTNTLSTTRVSATGNVSAGNIKTDHLLYANGDPYVFTTSAAGSDTQVQYNNSTAFGASANFTYNNTTKTLTVDKITANGAGITYITGANVNGNVTSAVQSHYANIANSVAGSNVSGQVGNALVAGTVYTNAQPNITSVGTLVSLSVSGDATVSGNFTVSGNTNFINVETFRVEDPIIELGGGVNGAPLVSNDGKDRGTLLHYYTTGVVDAFMGWDNSNAEFAFGSNVSVSSEVVTFNSFGNVRANYFIGNGATLTYITGSTVNGNVASAVQSHYANIANSVAGSNVSGQVGNALVAGTVYTNAQPNITSVGTLTSLTVAGNITSGNADLGNLVTANFFSGNGVYLTYITGANVNGNVTSAVQAHYANIANSVAGSNVSGQVGNALVAGTVYTNAQPNITSVGTLTSLNVTGNITSGNANLGNLVTANFFSGDGGYLSNLQISTATVANANYANFAGTAFSVSGSNVSGQVGNALVAGTVYTNAQPNITSVGTLTSLTVTGNITSGNANLGNLATASYFSGNGIYLSTITGANVSGNVTSAVQAHYANIANYVLGSNVSGTVANANYATWAGVSFESYAVSGPNVVGGVANANYATYSGTAFSVTGSNVSGQVGNALLAGTVYTNAQPNITSVGSLSGLTVSNATGVVDFTTTANVTLGNVSNLHISGGTAGYVLKTDGAGNLSWGIDTSAAGGNTTEIQFNDGGALNGNTKLTFDKTSGILTVTGNISTTNANLGNLVTANYFTGNGSYLTNITGANVNGNVTSAIQSHYANIANSVAGSNVSGQVSNALVAGTVYTNAQPNITSVGTLTSLTVTGNITSGNANLGNLVTASYFSGNGIYISNIAGANVSGNVTSAIQSHYANIANSVSGANVSGQVSNALVAGTVYTNAQPNITSVGVLTELIVANTVLADGYRGRAGGDISLASGGLNGNVVLIPDGSGITNLSGKPLGNVSTISASGNITAGNINGGNLVTANYFSGDGSLLTGLPAGYANSNVAAYLPTYTGNVSANYFIGNGATLTYITGANVSGNVTSAVQAHYANIANSVSGSNVSGQVSNALIAGTVYTNAQPNITSLGTLSSLTVNGITTLGSVSNVKISGGTSGYVLTTNGSGDVSWQASGGSAGPGFVNITKNSYVANGIQTAFILTTTPASEDAILVNIDGILQQDAAYTLSGSTVTLASAPYAGEVVEITVYGTLGLGSNTQVIFNDAGNVGATSNFVFNKTTNLLTVSNATISSGLITLDTGTINVSSGNATIFTSGISNITLGSTSSNVISQGNLSAKNYNTSGNLTVTDTGTITSLKVNDLYSNRTPVNVSTNTVIDSFPVNKYRSAKYTMRVNSDDGYQAVEVLLIHDGSDSFVTIYGSLSTSGTEIVSLSSNILSGAVRVLATTTSTNTTVNLMATYVAD